MKRLVCLLSLSCLALLAATAQSNATIDQVLTESRISFTHAAWLALSAGQVIPDTAEPSDAVEAVKKLGITVPANPDASPVSLGDYSFLIMKSLGLQGGVIYSIIPSGHYALRELVYRKALSSPVWENETLSGEEAMRILLKALDAKEKQK